MDHVDLRQYFKTRQKHINVGCSIILLSLSRGPPLLTLGDTQRPLTTTNKVSELATPLAISAVESVLQALGLRGYFIWAIAPLAPVLDGKVTQYSPG